MSYDYFVFCTALNFIRNHIGQFLAGREEKLIALCADSLKKQYDLTARTAERISILALGEVQAGRKTPNLEIADGQVVYVRDPEKREIYALTASMLRRIAPKYGVTLQHP